jgi:ABC-2 type transport system ATP-binding protein
MLTSILKPTLGRARVAGYDVVTQPAQVRANVGVLTEQHGLYERMKPLDYLDFFGRIYKLSASERRRRALDLLERFGLADEVNRRLGEYSKGMKQKLALVRAMLHNPRLCCWTSRPRPWTRRVPSSSGMPSWSCSVTNARSF